MFLEASTIEAMLIVGAIGGIAGIIGGFLASADNLFGALLMGIIGGIVGASVLRIAGAPSILSVGEGDFSAVWGALGGLILGFVVGRSNV